MWHTKPDAYSRHTLGFVMEAGLPLFLESLMITKESWGSVKLSEVTKFFLFFALNIVPITQGKNFVF